MTIKKKPVTKTTKKIKIVKPPKKIVGRLEVVDGGVVEGVVVNVSVGRPTDYKVEYNELARNYCLLGATDIEMAKFFDVSEQTLNAWKNAHPLFLESIKAGKEDADGNVANRLYQRAMGFEHDSEEIKVIGSSVERVKVRKVYAPDTAAAIFWLKNRQKDKWRDKIETEHSGEVGLNKLSDEQIEALLTEKLKGKK